jgi:polyhydroxyalkanoate synthesis regulator phasin
MVIGRVPEAKRVGDTVWFRAEVGEEKLIEKILRNYVTHVSIQVDSDDVECSKCKRQTRKEGILFHLCSGAWEIVHKPRVRELSIVASPAYKNTVFQPAGFGAAMNDSQWDAIVSSVSQSSKYDKDVGSKGDLQEPENKKIEAKEEVKHLSQNAEKDASPHQAQGVANVAPGETAPKQVEYEDLMNQLQKLEKQIYQGPGVSDAELDFLKKKVAELDAEMAKRATKRQLSKKISELSKKLSEAEAEAEAETAEGAEGEAEAEAETAEGADAEAKKGSKAGPTKHATGQGIVAVDEIQRDALGNYDWFKDILKAHKKLLGFK